MRGFLRSIIGIFILASSTCLAQSSWQTARDHPFQGEFDQTLTQTGEDGKVVTTEWRGILARDAAGRTVKQQQKVGDPWQVVYGEVNDPVGRLSIRWDGRQKLAVITHYSESAAKEAGGYFRKILPTPGLCETRNPTSYADLGSRAFEGTSAKGCRITTTSQSGTGANAKTVLETTEVWTAWELGLEVQSRRESHEKEAPEKVVQGDSWVVKNLRASEPDASLFRIPAAYTVLEDNH